MLYETFQVHCSISFSRRISCYISEFLDYVRDSVRTGRIKTRINLDYYKYYRIL